MKKIKEISEYNFFEWIFNYKSIKKEYEDKEKEVTLTIKEREDIKDTKNKMIKALRERMETIETMLETKDNLLKKRDKQLHENKEEMTDLKAHADLMESERDSYKSQFELSCKELENLNLELNNLKDELQQKKRLLSRFEVTKEEIKAYENHHNKVLKKIRKKNVSDGSMETDNS